MSNNNNKKDSSFLLQGSILAVASIVSRIIGMLYRIPMTNIIGEHGNDYYSCAFEIYSMVLLISSYSLPAAVSKTVSFYLAKDEQHNVRRVFRGALVISVITGLAGCLFIFFGAEFLTGVFQTPMAYLSLRVLAPTILIVAVMGVFRGYFQGTGTMIPSSISQLIEQIINAVVSVAAAFILFGYGNRIASVLGSEKHYDAAYGAAGGTLGTGVGALFGLLFLLFVFGAYRKKMKRKIRREQKKGQVKTDSYGSIVKTLIWTIFPILLSTTIYNSCAIVDQGIFKNLAVMQGNASDTVSTWWGIYSGYYNVLTQVPISISTALAASCLPAISAAIALKDAKGVQHRIDLSMRFIMIVAMPCMIGMMVLANPIVKLLFPGAPDLAGYLIQAGGLSIIFYSISTLSNTTLQGIDRMRIPIRNALISLGINILTVVVCVLVFKINIYAVVISKVTFSLSMCILNSMAVRKYSGYKPNIRKTFFKPAVASVLMGIIVFVCYKLCMKLIQHNSISTIVGILIGIISYFVILLLIKGVTEEELRSFPKGTVIVKVAKKVHLLR